LARKRDIKQFRQACREMGLTARARRAASDALHAEKRTSSPDLTYRELIEWLREWKR